jgi:hypothetical protein
LKLAACALAVPALLAGGAAAAQPADGAGEVPACATLDRADGQRRAGVDAGYVFFGDAGPLGSGDITGMRVDVSAQYVTAAGLGGYAIVPLSYGKIESSGIERSDTSLGNVEIGGVFVAAARPGLTIAAHLGATLPTTPGLDPADFSGYATYLAYPVRPHDLVQQINEAGYVRAGVTPLYRRGDLFLRAEAGVDVPVHNGGLGDASDLPKLGHLDLAGGLATPRFAVLGELLNIVNLEFDDETGDDVIHYAALTARFTGAPVQPSLSVMSPLDRRLRDEVDLVLLAGVQAPLP